MRWMLIALGVVMTIGASGQGFDVEYVHPAQAGLDPAHQFDFWVGEWDINNRMLRGDGSWNEWPSQAIIEAAVGGQAIVEFWNSLVETPDIVGFSMRWYDQEAGEWVIVLNWPRTSGSFNTMVGKFRHGRGEFYEPGFWEENKQSGERYTFTDVSATSLRWDQAVTSDGGKTWHTNWVMEWRRRDHKADPIDRDKHHRVADTRCDAPETRAFDDWVGEWKNRLKQDEIEYLRIRRVLGGCGLLFESVSEFDGPDTIYQNATELITYNVGAGKWQSVRIIANSLLTFGTVSFNDDKTVFSYVDRDGEASVFSASYRLNEHKFEEQKIIMYELHRDMYVGNGWDRAWFSRHQRTDNDNLKKP